MTPFDHASRIIPVDLVDSKFVVSLASESLRLVLSMDLSSSRADHIALIGRQIVAGEVESAVAFAKANAYCHVAAEVDDRFYSGRIFSPLQISQLCRQFAELHSCK